MTYRTRQEIFDDCLIPLFQQGRPCMHNAACMYRNDQGHHCAIGFLIPDDQYDRNMEGDSISNRREIRVIARISDDDLDFAQRVQSCHDDSWHTYDERNPQRFLQYLYREAEKVAKEYNLSLDAVQAVYTEVSNAAA